jgi:hypothetical protein
MDQDRYERLEAQLSALESAMRPHLGRRRCGGSCVPATVDGDPPLLEYVIAVTVGIEQYQRSIEEA